MKFTVATKPLADSLNLAIVNANISQYYSKSCVVEVSVDGSVLRINVEAKSIRSEIKLKGKNDTNENGVAFVSSTLLKQLVSTFEDAVTTFEFVSGGVVLYSGKSKFTLPNLVEEDEMTLTRPTAPATTDVAAAKAIDKADWRFIKDHQMFALSMSFIHPVYTRVWAGQTGDVIVGDYDNTLFTHSEKSKLGTTCLLTDTIINLFNSLPDGAKLIRSGDAYIIVVDSDSFEFLSEFVPEYESDVGSYNSDILLEVMSHPESGDIRVDVAPLNRFLSQAELILSSTDAEIQLDVGDGVIKLYDNDVNCVVPVAGTGITPNSYTLTFKVKMLKSVLSNYSEQVYINPTYTDDEISGIVIWDKELTTVLAGM